MDGVVELDIVNSYRSVCSACLSGDRNLISINGLHQIYSIFRLIMYDFAGDRFGETLDQEVLVCWECLALLKRLLRFKRQVHSAQEHLRVLAMSQAQETLDHTYMSQSLSTLEMCLKADYDKIYFDYTAAEEEWPAGYISIHPSSMDVKNEHFDVAQVVRDNIQLDIDEQHLLEVPQLVLENPLTGAMSHVVVDTDALITHTVKGELADLSETKCTIAQPMEPSNVVVKKPGYVVECMTEAEMNAMREEMKQKVQYASSVYKCELCIIGFYTQQQVEDHFVSAHRAKPGQDACKVCYIYTAAEKLPAHEASHFIRHRCTTCGRVEASEKLAQAHQELHRRNRASGPKRTAVCVDQQGTKSKKKKDKNVSQPAKPGDLRKLLSKTTIEGYQCLECDMFFKNSRARKSHVARFHREGLQCDHCKKRFVNRTTLATHLRLHEGPLPRDECPICHKMVRVNQLKYHIRRHQNKERYECAECNKVFSHLTTYQAHLRYSRAHASEQVFKFPCPMCNKGYPTKEQMLDHFNYQHLGKTSHKCPICDKPIASRANVEKHMMRVHREKKEKPRNHRCQLCGKAFTDKKALTQHEVIHSGDRPLQCEICQQTFKQKASLYTHKKRVHKVFPVKRVVEFMDVKIDNNTS